MTRPIEPMVPLGVLDLTTLALDLAATRQPGPRSDRPLARSGSLLAT